MFPVPLSAGVTANSGAVTSIFPDCSAVTGLPRPSASSASTVNPPSLNSSGAVALKFPLSSTITSSDETLPDSSLNVTVTGVPAG